jgi:hypothetical protein
MRRMLRHVCLHLAAMQASISIGRRPSLRPGQLRYGTSLQRNVGRRDLIAAGGALAGRPTRRGGHTTSDAPDCLEDREMGVFLRETLAKAARGVGAGWL